MQEIRETNFFSELRFVLYHYRTVYILFGVIVPAVFIIFSGAISWIHLPPSMINRSAYSLIPVGIMVVGHTMGPILLSPPLMLVKF